MSLPSRSAPRPDPEQKELWRFEVSVDHTPAFRRLKAPVDRGQLQRCLPQPAVSAACHACSGERKALSSSPRRSRRPSAPWSGGGDLSGGSRHGPVKSSAYLLKNAESGISCNARNNLVSNLPRLFLEIGNAGKEATPADSHAPYHPDRAGSH